VNATASTAAPGPSADEAGLLEQARSGDRLAQDALVRRYLPDVYRAALRVLGNRESAEDAAQDAFLSALRALPGFRGESSFRTWLLRIAVNAARSHGRRWLRRRESALDEASGVAVAAADGARGLEQKEAGARLEQALAQLPPKQRLTVALRVQQDLSYREIAAVTGGTEGGARVNYHLGMKRLRELLR